MNPDVLALPAAPEVAQFEVGSKQNFCELVFCPVTRQAAVVDPAWEAERLLREAAARALRITTVLITHTHHDHIEGVAEVVARTGARVVVHPHERARVPGATAGVLDVADRLDVAIGERGVRCLETFGHTPGGTCFLADGFVITGDVLFVGGCGRTDFPGGDTAALWRSLQRLRALPGDTVVFPGHNYGATATSTVARQAEDNPYLRCTSFEEFRALRERPRTA